jgi:hypothetical protein
MKSHYKELFLLVTVSFTLQNGFAQKIELNPADPGQIIRVQTALNHLTVIEVPGPVTMVAAGSQAFKVERRDNKVFVQPLEEGQSTNLFIWTPTTRYNYELAPAGDIAGMHFAIDHAAPVVPVNQNSLETLPKAAISPDSNTLLSRALVESLPVKNLGTVSARDRVGIVVRDVLKTADRVLIRYSIRNRGGEAYQVETPLVTVLEEPKSKHSLIPLSLTQLDKRDAERIRKKGRTPLEVVQAEVTAKTVSPGEEVVGVIAVKPIGESGIQRSVIQLQFRADQKGPVTATLVL